MAKVNQGNLVETAEKHVIFFTKISKEIASKIYLKDTNREEMASERGVL